MSSSSDSNLTPYTAPCPLCGVEVVGVRDDVGRFFPVRGTDHATDCNNRSTLGYCAPPVECVGCKSINGNDANYCHACGSPLVGGKPHPLTAIAQVAANLSIARERGRLEANRTLWDDLRAELERAGLLGVYGVSMAEARHPTLHRLVEEWQSATAVCKAAFERYVLAARRELGAVGGRASTAASEAGYVHEFILHEGMPCEGGGRGEPVHPEVGALLLQLQRDHREAAFAQHAAVNAVREYVSARGGGDNPEHVALALLRDEGAMR